MNDVAKNLAAALHRVLRTLPGVKGINISAPCDAPMLSLSAESEEAAYSIAEALGLPAPSTVDGVPGSVMCMTSGALDPGGAYILIAGPLRTRPPATPALDPSVVEAACSSLPSTTVGAVP